MWCIVGFGIRPQCDTEVLGMAPELRLGSDTHLHKQEENPFISYSVWIYENPVLLIL